MSINSFRGIMAEPVSRIRAAAGKYLVVLPSVFMLFSFIVAGCGTEQATPPKEVNMALSLSSTVFTEGGRIPVKYTCDGQDVSPQLTWSEPPQKTQTLAMIVDDPDAPGGVFTHWVLFNIPGSVRQLGEGVPAQERFQNGSLQGKNDFGRVGYGGPCPPRGSLHHYRFTIYALDRSMDLKPGASKKQLLDAMKGHILAQGSLTGTYQC